VLDFRIGASGSRYTTAFTGHRAHRRQRLSWTLPAPHRRGVAPARCCCSRSRSPPSRPSRWAW
jgi:hypothetical protein